MYWWFIGTVLERNLEHQRKEEKRGGARERPGKLSETVKGGLRAADGHGAWEVN